MKKTILLVINSAAEGGAGKILKLLAKLYSEYGNNVIFLSIYGEDLCESLPPKVRFVTLNETPKGYFIWRINAIRKLRQVCKQEQVDIVLSFMSDVSLLTMLALVGLKIKHISSERNDPYNRCLVWKLLSCLAYGRSDICVFQLEGAKSFFPSFIQRKSIVIPNPIGNSKPLTFTKRKKTIVGAGRFVEEKRFEDLIKAFGFVHNKYPEYKLVLYGKGHLYDEYIRIIKKLGLSEFVEFPGYIRDLREQFASDGIFVLSSSSEGIPNVLIEALSAGMATVSTNCTPGGAKYLTENGKYGMLIPIGDVKAMANCLIKLIKNEDLKIQMEAHASEALNKIDSDEIAKLWLSILDK